MTAITPKLQTSPPHQSTQGKTVFAWPVRTCSLFTNRDVATVKKFLNDQAHPGRDRKSGSFGFAGHNDPVAFRNIRIKSL